MEPLTLIDINQIKDDETLQGRLCEELARLIGESYNNKYLDSFVATLATLPAGLRAMAATYDLDVSMALDSLSWHFMNHHSKSLAVETLSGLHTLGATAEAKVFEEAFSIAVQHWDELVVPPDLDSPLEHLFEPLDEKLWGLLGYGNATGRSLLKLWVSYARAYPENCCIAL